MNFASYNFDVLYKTSYILHHIVGKVRHKTNACDPVPLLILGCTCNTNVFLSGGEIIEFRKGNCT